MSEPEGRPALRQLEPPRARPFAPANGPASPVRRCPHDPLGACDTQGIPTMARIFVSHSSSDKDFVHRLAGDLTERGHRVWLDEWEIKVGECIPTRIAEGLKESDFVVLVMSQRACASAWVDREWKSKYWEEVNTRQLRILPILLETCDIPHLLKAKRYAEFRSDYEVGLLDLLAAVEHSVPVVAPAADSGRRSELLFDLLAAVQARQQPLSAIFVDVLRHAQQLAHAPLVEFARREISGYSLTPGPLEGGESSATELLHRRISGYIGLHEINPMFMGWSGGMAPALAYMRQDKDFNSFTIIFSDPLARIEANLLTSSSQKLLSMQIPLSSISGKPSKAQLNFYAAGDTFTDMYERIRLQAVKHLADASA